MNPRLAGTAILALSLSGCSDKAPDPLVSPGCTSAVSPLAVSLGQNGEAGIVGVQTTAGCPWTARSNTNWITITAGTSGIGNGSLSYSAQANFETSARTGTLTVADVTVTMMQAAFSSAFSSPFVGRWRNEDPETPANYQSIDSYIGRRFGCPHVGGLYPGMRLGRTADLTG